MDEDLDDILPEDPIQPGSYLPKYSFCLACRASTANGKPFCINHLDRIEYVQKIGRELEVRAHEESNAHKKYARINLKGSRATEILDLIQYRGALTLSRIASELDLPRKALKGYLVRLERAGLLSQGSLTTRRKTFIKVVVAKKKRAK